VTSQALAAKTTSLAGFKRKKPFPEVMPLSDRMRKLGQDITESLDAIPRQFRDPQFVHEKFTFSDC
jgi:transposase